MPIETVSLSAAPPAVVSVSMEPVLNQVYSLMLLVKDDRMPGVGDWVVRTREGMSLEERHRNRLVVWGLYYAFTPVAHGESFGAYLDHLASLSPESFRERLMSCYARIDPSGCGFEEPGQVPRSAWEGALESTEAYLAFLTRHFGPALVEHDLEAQAFEYVRNPPAMKSLIVDHLRHMWERWLAPEWTRVRPLVRESVEAFGHADLGRRERADAVRYVIGRELPDQKLETLVQDAEEIVLVPSAHVGPYLGRLLRGRTLVLFFGARSPRLGDHEAPDLSRAEILASLSSLADDNRLRILRMAAEGGEVRVSQVMEGLDMSQSAASRNLSQLVGAGFLRERRSDGAKVYSLNTTRISNSVRAIARHLGVPWTGAAEGGSEDA